MDLLALAVPFFLLALLIELIVDRIRGSGYFRSNDAINSLSAGTLSTTTGYFTRFFQVFIWGYVLQEFALMHMELAWFDLSARGLALWAAALIGWDFCYYWAHRLGHEVSILWRRMPFTTRARTTIFRQHCGRQAAVFCSTGYSSCRFS